MFTATAAAATFVAPFARPAVPTFAALVAAVSAVAVADAAALTQAVRTTLRSGPTPSRVCGRGELVALAAAGDSGWVSIADAPTA